MSRGTRKSGKHFNWPHSVSDVPPPSTNSVLALLIRSNTMAEQLEKQNKELEDYARHLEQLLKEKERDAMLGHSATILALIKAAELRDDDTGAHVKRTAEYCKYIAGELRKSGTYIGAMCADFEELIYLASPLHDVGKIGIKDEILLKPSKLTPLEFDVIKGHTVIGYDMLIVLQRLHCENETLRFGVDIARSHHERWDGLGYPDGVKGTDIPLSARIMTIADVYDSLRSKRVYKTEYSHDKSLCILEEGNGKNFDPEILGICIDKHMEFSRIYQELTTG